LPDDRGISWNHAMTALELRFLGQIEVVRGGKPIALPPSKKTRALLAYLALNQRTFRREHLCELLWEIPDDPRGSLRWSLSKLRQLVDDDTRQRIVADRVGVRFDTADAAIDIAELKGLVELDLDNCPLERLEDGAARLCGAPLEGLDLPDFHDFNSWYAGERESAIRAQMRLLFALIHRLSGNPEGALPHARTLARIAPYDEPARATLVRTLLAVGNVAQAEQQYQIGTRMLSEAGIAPTGELQRAARGAPRTPSRPERAPPGITGNGALATVKVSTFGLVGREAEVASIEEVLRETITQHRDAFVLVHGEPGIGKSRLLEAAAELARYAGALLLEARAYASESIRPFALWTDALRKLGPETTTAIFGKGDHTNRDHLFGGLSDLIAARAHAQPVVLMFDDLHWGDESSAAALHYVARTNREQSLFGILAARTDELHDNAPMVRALRELRHGGLLREIKLGPLTEEAVREIIQTRSPDADSARLSRACGGNPLLAIELAQAEASGDSGKWLSELVQERLARLEDDGGEVLRWAAVLAPRIDASTLSRIASLDWNRIGETLETAARQSMLVPVEHGFRFSHDLIADSIYAAISPARRRSMHRRVAEVLEKETALDPERAAELAHHAAQSGDAGLAARAMVSAGRLCLRFFANAEAVSLADKGLLWVEPLPPAERICLTLELREIMLSAAPVEHWEDAARECAMLAEQALDHGALSHARRGYYMAGYLHWMHGHWSGAREVVLQSERVARGGSDEEHVIGMAEAARCLAMLERDLPQADAMLLEAQAIASRKKVSHHAIPAAVGMLRFHENKLGEAAERFREARTLARSSGDRISEFQANEYLAMIEIERGRPDAAREHCAVLIELGEKLRDGSERPFAYALDALCNYAINDETGPLESALEELRVADAKHRLAYTLTHAALLDLERGRPEAAVAQADEALTYAESLGRATETMLAHVVLAHACRIASDTTGYQKHLSALERLETAPVAAWARGRAAGLALPEH
jgi:DNA-binding SARP family transcriptional activator